MYFPRSLLQQMAEIAGNWMATSSHNVKFVRKTVPTKVELVEEGPPRRLKVEYKNTETGETGSEEFNTVSWYRNPGNKDKIETAESLIWILIGSDVIAMYWCLHFRCCLRLVDIQTQRLWVWRKSEST